MRFQTRRDGARYAELIGDAVEGVCEENVIDRLRHNRIDRHGVRQDEIAVGCPRLYNPHPSSIQRDRFDIDRVDAICDGREGRREQPVSATEVNRDHARSDAHFDENIFGMRPQHPPPVGIGHRCCREKADDHPILTRAWDWYALTAKILFNHSGD